MNWNTIRFIAAILVPLVGNTLSLCIWHPLLSIQPGTVIRLMLEASESMGVMVVTLAVGLAIGCELNSRGRWIWGWLCMLFSLTPFFVNWLVVNWICSARQLTWAD